MDLACHSGEGGEDDASALIPAARNIFVSEATGIKYCCDNVKLGSGAFGKVLLATNTQTSQKVAIKVISNLGQGPQEREQEIDSMKLLLAGGGSPHVVELLDVVKAVESNGPSHLHHLVMPKFEMSLNSFLNYPNSRPLEVKQEVTRQLYSGLAYIHANHVVHRDIGYENIMLDLASALFKFIDFGAGASGDVVDEFDQMFDTLALAHRIVLPTWLARKFRSLRKSVKRQATQTPEVHESALTAVFGVRTTAVMNLKRNSNAFYEERSEKCRKYIVFITNSVLSNANVQNGGTNFPDGLKEAMRFSLLLGNSQEVSSSNISKLLDAAIPPHIRHEGLEYIKSKTWQECTK
eukprot:scpid87994/ scgid9556/ Probable serine/threonine-protein kinase MARK-C